MKKNSTKKNDKTNDRAKGFLNWSVKTAAGETIRSDKGLPIWQNPKYPSKREDMLLDLATKHGGTVEIPMMVRVSLNTPAPVINLDDIITANTKSPTFGTPVKKKTRKSTVKKTKSVSATNQEKPIKEDIFA